MAKSILNIGTAVNDGTGDTLRGGATKINANTTELYNALGDGTNLLDIVNSSLEIDVPVDDAKVNKISFKVGTNNALNAINASTYHGVILHNHESGTVHVAHGGTWHKLLMDTSGGAITNYTDPIKSIAYLGNINALTDVDTTSNPPQTGNVLKWDGGKWAPGTDATTGGAGTDADTLDGQDGSYYLNYNNLNNKPSIPTVLTDLSITQGSAAQVLTSNGNGTFTWTTPSSGGNQNIFATVDADSGTTTANSQTDTLTVAGGDNISTTIVGDTVTIAYTGSPNSGEVNQLAFSNVASDSGTAAADSKTDTLTIAGGTNISTSVSGDTVTIDYSGSNDLNSLTDVNTTGVATGNILVKKSGGWEDSGYTLDQIAYPAITTLVVTADNSNGYKFDQYGVTEDPTIYCLAGATIAFNLNDSSMSMHPFQIETSGGVQYNNGLVHVAPDGTETTGVSAQGATSGTLYWKVPSNISGNYQYQCTAHAAMQGTIVVKDMSAI